MREWDAASLLALTAVIEDGPAKERPFSHRFVRRLLSLGEPTLEGAVPVLRSPDGVAERIRRLLLNRCEAEKLIGRYRRRGFEICLPSHPDWPPRLRSLGDLQPIYLFVAGNRACFRGRHISVAGSRDVAREAAKAAEELGEGARAHGCVLVSGNARGTDQICQRAALRAGGRILLFPATRGEIWKEDKALGAAFESGSLLIATETLPDEPFSAAKALSRNHMIYAMGEPAVVVAARENCGGSWRGAVDCLSHGWADVLAVTGKHRDFAGCHLLVSRGAHPLEANGRTLWDQIETWGERTRAPIQMQMEIMDG